LQNGAWAIWPEQPIMTTGALEEAVADKECDKNLCPLDGCGGELLGQLEWWVGDDGVDLITMHRV
jgi:hypothetical protein